MNFERKSAEAPMRALMIGNESLLVECAKIWRAHGHEVATIVTRNADIAAWAKGEGLECIHHSSSLSDVSLAGEYDWLLSIANLQIIPDALLAKASRGAVNFHDGPLPKYAGLNAPVWARLHGEASHGITWHLIEGGIDKGDILAQRSFEVRESDTALTLNTKCFSSAIDSFPEVVAGLSSPELPRQKQDFTARSYFGLSARPAGFARLDFRKNTAEVVNVVRALDHGTYVNPLTCAKIAIGGDILLVGSAEAVDGRGQPGQIVDFTEVSLTVATADGAVQLSDISDQNGVSVKLSQYTATQTHLPSLDRIDGLTKAHQETAKHDAFWRKRLAEYAPATLPLLVETDEQPDLSSLPIAVPDGMNVAARIASVGVFAKVSGADDPINVAYCPSGLTTATGYLSTWVPLTVTYSQETSIEALIAETAGVKARVEGKDTFALDIAARDPSLGPIQTPDIAIIADPDAGPVPGVAFNVILSDTGMRLRYDRNRLTPEHAARLVARLELISQQVAAGQGTIAQMQTLPDAERKELLLDWNDTQTDVDLNQTIHGAIAVQAAETPDAVAVVFEHATLTYSQLEERANQTARHLQSIGVTKGDVVGVHCKRSLDLVVACIAVMKAGAAYLPLDPSFPADRIAMYIEDSATKFILTQSGIASELPKTDAQLVEIDKEIAISASSMDPVDGGATGQDLAYLIFTSGSTGRPKGVMLEHRNVSNFFAGMDSRIQRDGPSTWLAVTSLSFDISVLELFYTLARGFKLVISGDESATQISNGPVGTSESGMDFSLYYWGNDDGAGPDKYKLLLEGAKFADDNGFCAVWTPERHFHAFGGPYPNPSVTGAAVAGLTKNIGVRAGSCVAPLHHTARIAEEWAVIDNLTNGKAGLAIASGWQPDDFVLRPENTPPANKPAMFEQIKDLRKLWKGEPVEFARQDGSMLPVITQPRPVSSEPALWVTTAGNPETWKEAGRNGTNVLTHLLGQSVDEVADKIKLYHEALRESGFNPADFQVTLMLHSFVGDDRESVREIAREPMKDYLRSAAGLIKQYAWAFPAFKKPEGVKNPFELDLGSLNEDEMEGILDFAFLRYFEDSGLFGTVDECVQRVESLKRIGVTEIACLIDYGIPTHVVLEGLKPLARVLELSNQTGGVAESDVSIAGQIIRHKATHLQCTPSMARMLTMNQEASIALGQVDHLMIGGEALSGALVADLNAVTGASVTNMYGPTETTIWSSTAVAKSSDGVVNIGQPIANTSLFVLDDQLQPVSMGIAGELFIGGEGVARGYWDRPELTAERFIQNPFEHGGDRLYRTGDLVRARLDGGLDFIGRADNQVKLRGYRIELGEIESRLEELPDIAQAVVIPREDTPGDTRLVAYLRGTAIEEQMRKHLSEHLPDYMVPSHFVTLESFPLTPNKKVDRKALPKPQKRVVAPVEHTQQASEVTKQITEIWSRILGVQGISGSDSFFDLGGHSLLAVQAHREIRDTLGHNKVSVTDIFRFPKLAALVDRIEALGGGGPQSSPVQPAAGQDQPKASTAPSRQEAMSKRRAMRARRREKNG
ncbi:MAG: MupA/Atu3671 family FMN-dependent luciferase-like monooxygenase [Cognatishimia sp.]